MNHGTSFFAKPDTGIAVSADTEGHPVTSDAPAIVVLMAVMNGADNLQAQLESIAAQTHRNWQILASDDGSTDETIQILRDFCAQGHQVQLLKGPEQGAAANFMSLARAAGEYAKDGCWLAFADQDDVWLPEKLERSVTRLQAGSPAERPALYCSRSWITRADLTGRQLSPPVPRAPGFRNALIQNIAAGNTICLNSAGSRLIINAAREAGEVVMHDWWTYQIVTGAGGEVLHDDDPTLLYRQHGANHIGANNSLRAKGRRISMLFDGGFRKWNDLNIKALKRSRARLTDENLALVEAFAHMRDKSLLTRLRMLHRLGLYRQTRAATLSLWLAAMLRRL
ncbi:MAG: glycosyltransferase [Rhodobacteraceae bacterium]|nr:glycosyltransferase [Paracoccaceae bacterium]